MLASATFFQHRKPGTNQLVPAFGSGNGADPKARTILVSSHVWWSELIGLAFVNLGYNVLFAYPWYFFYTEEKLWNNFDQTFADWIKIIKDHKVDLILGGNTTAMVMHPKTREMLHNAAGVPAANYWWDEVRMTPPCANRNPKDAPPIYTHADYLKMLSAPQTLNVIWDRDVMEELAAFSGITNTVHVPLGTTPDFWPQIQLPMKERKIPINFLGNCHYDATACESDPSALYAWARDVAAAKLAAPTTPMVDVIRARPIPAVDGDDWQQFTQPWISLGNILMQRARNVMVRTMAAHMRGRFLLLGSGWEKFNITAAAAHSGVPKSGEYYANSLMSLNLAGGCVHGGLPLRPYEIACSNGLILAHHTRELGEHYEIGKECLAFRTPEELVAQIDRVMADPTAFEPMIAAGKQRTIACHTWEHRARALIQHAKEKLNLKWE